jgi:hypothetical protein
MMKKKTITDDGLSRKDEVNKDGRITQFSER